MKTGIIGFIVLILGMAILAIIFILTQTKVIEQGIEKKQDTQQIQNQVNQYNNQIKQKALQDQQMEVSQ